MRILGVDKNSVGDELGIKAGDELIAFDGEEVVDILDYEFFNGGENFILTVSRDGELTDYEIEKYPDEDLGLKIDDNLGIRVCKNKCIFCFVDQLPKGKLRPTLKIKDDDYRHSFISGSYITLTNDTMSDLDRIIRRKLSPVYVSVHSSDPKIRRYMLGNSAAPDVLRQLEYLKAGGIKIHAQIVYCPGVNEDVVKTVLDTAPYCESIAVVPVGLTKDCNKALRAVDKLAAEKIIDAVTPLQAEFSKSKGTAYVFLADEFYLKAEREFPSLDSYEDFPQIDNGVGLIPLFNSEVNAALADFKGLNGDVGKITIATGVAAFETIKKAAEKVVNVFGGEIEVRAVRNDFFGESVTVAGLVTGGDILRELKNYDIGDRLIIPRCMLKEFGDVFLDNTSVSELASELNTKIEAIAADGYSFVKGCARL